MADINFLAVLLAGVAHVALGVFWYHPKVFGGAWMQLSGMSPEGVERGKKNMFLKTVIAFAAALAMAYMLSVVLLISGQIGADITFDTFSWAFLLWAGFIFPVMLGVVLWEAKSTVLLAINAGYWLCAVVLMSGIIVLVR